MSSDHSECAETVKQIMARYGETAEHFYARTGHCQRCGNPGNYCTCPRNREDVA